MSNPVADILDHLDVTLLQALSDLAGADEIQLMPHGEALRRLEHIRRALFTAAREIGTDLDRLRANLPEGLPSIHTLRGVLPPAHLRKEI